MDPWITPVSDVCDPPSGDIEILEGSNELAHLVKTLNSNSTSAVGGGGGCGGGETFEDDFIPSSINPVSVQFKKLPDSDVYLASLEKKLQKIQSVSDKKDKAKEILKSLEESRESCMQNLLSGTSLQESQFEDLKVNPLLKKFHPEKQALSVEELIQLVKYDQLAAASDEEEAKTEPHITEILKSDI